MAIETYKGWSIELGFDNWYHATASNYDASYEGEENGWVDNGEKCSAKTIAELHEEIDLWIEEHL